MYFCQYRFICRLSDSTVSEDAGIEPRTVATLTLAVRRSNQSARSHSLYQIFVIFLLHRPFYQPSAIGRVKCCPDHLSSLLPYLWEHPSPVSHERGGGLIYTGWVCLHNIAQCLDITNINSGLTGQMLGRVSQLWKRNMQDFSPRDTLFVSVCIVYIVYCLSENR
jgi:hypothetical protein